MKKSTGLQRDFQPLKDCLNTFFVCMYDSFTFSMVWHNKVRYRTYFWPLHGDIVPRSTYVTTKNTWMTTWIELYSHAAYLHDALCIWGPRKRSLNWCHEILFVQHKRRRLWTPVNLNYCLFVCVTNKYSRLRPLVKLRTAEAGISVIIKTGFWLTCATFWLHFWLINAVSHYASTTRDTRWCV